MVKQGTFCSPSTSGRSEHADQARANLVQAIQSGLPESDYTRPAARARQDHHRSDLRSSARKPSQRQASVSNNEAAVRQAELDMEFTEARTGE
jgi:multidrug resistance efflux pump